MNRTSETSYGYDGSRIVHQDFCEVNMFSDDSASYDVIYVLPLYLKYLVVKHYEIPIDSSLEIEFIELKNVDFVKVEEDETFEAQVIIDAQNEHDAYLLKPFKTSIKQKGKALFK